MIFRISEIFDLQCRSLRACEKKVEWKSVKYLFDALAANVCISAKIRYLPLPTIFSTYSFCVT